MLSRAITRQKFRSLPNVSWKLSPRAKNPWRDPSSSASRPPVEKARVGVAAAAVVDVGEGGAVESKPSRRRLLPPLQKELSPICLGPKKQRPKRERSRRPSPKRKLCRNRPVLLPPYLLLRHGRRRASSFSPLDCPVPGRVPGSSATMWFRSPATWFDHFCSMTFASSVFRILCFPTCVPC